MKTLTQVALVAVAVALLPALSRASLQVNGTLAFGDSNYVGFIHDGVPSNPASEVGYINNLKTLSAGAGVTNIGGSDYDRLSSTLGGALPTAVLANSVTDDVAPVNPLVITSGFQYILAKYGGGGASNGGDLVWYFADGITGTVTLPATYNGRGISHSAAFNKVTTVVPEPGTIAVWGLLAVAGYFGVKKYQAKA